MNITVFIKQVPDTNDVKWTADNNIDRTNMESILNPADAQAIEAALILKDTYGAEVTAVTMGPSKAEAVLQEAIAMGADNAMLLCDSKFAGSDTNATSNVLSAVIKEKLKDTDILLFGQSAIDGETGQTGISTAARLNLPCITHVNEIVNVQDDYVNAVSETETDKITYKVKLPAVICVNNYIIKPRLPKISGYIKAQEYIYHKYNMFDLNVNETQIGVKGSPTYVKSVFKNQENRNCKFTDNINEIINEIKSGQAV